jgi:hypothetical protein
MKSIPWKIYGRCWNYTANNYVYWQEIIIFPEITGYVIRILPVWVNTAFIYWLDILPVVQEKENIF